MSHFHETRIKDLEEQLSEARATIQLMTKAQRLVKIAGLATENERLREALENLVSVIVENHDSESDAMSRFFTAGDSEHSALSMAREAIKECER